MTWRSCALATIVTTGVLASSNAFKFGSVSARPPALRVEPNAARWAFLRFISDMRAKNSMSLGFDPG